MRKRPDIVVAKVIRVVSANRVCGRPGFLSQRLSDVPTFGSVLIYIVIDIPFLDIIADHIALECRQGGFSKKLPYYSKYLLIPF